MLLKYPVMKKILPALKPRESRARKALISFRTKEETKEAWDRLNERGDKVDWANELFERALNEAHRELKSS